MARHRRVRNWPAGTIYYTSGSAMAHLAVNHSGSPQTLQPASVVPASSPGAGTLALGFGMTVAMWGVGYFCRLPRSTGADAPRWCPMRC